MKYIIDRSKLRAMDFGFTSDISAFSLVEKCIINGVGAALTDWKVKLPTHVFHIIEIEGHLKILEMIPDNNDKGKMKLTLTGIEKYENNGIFGDRVIAIRRCDYYDDENIRATANDRCIKKWAENKTNYDIEELLFWTPFARLFKMKNSPEKLVCSSELEATVNANGLTFTDFPLHKNPQGLIAPWDEMKTTYLTDKSCQKFYRVEEVKDIYLK